ncbi:hypothetical protein ARALYDRAFT_354960 [Arabidopsis lyrata subsp. lyrata]|uniref:RING-type domain-containing protein n=1 Tax=Arabidopsis lyrata subsp. lyrata TaxID=81972 RepID=D7MDD3_ARALL|nr:hypothetical protein ARALYDRAFT_354960 [Arabidopsis lyrata subsp. lyrata]
MDSLPKQTLNPNKHLKEQFVSNLDGSSILEIAALLTIVPLLVLLRYSIDFHWKIDNNNGGIAVSSKKNDDEIVVSRNWKAYTHAISLDFILIVFPMLLFFTVLSEWVYLGAVLLSLLLLILSLTAKRSSSGLQRGQSLSFRASVSSYRVALMLITCLCILAVDFTIFPRRYAKTETYGTSLMDLGVGSFVLANAIVSRQARDVSSGNWITGLKATAPLLLLALIRLVTTSGVDYQVHVTEYGVHWNFFFTLAAISILTSFVNIPAKYCGILGFSVLAGYQTWLISGLNTYLLSDERGTDIISKNKEGVYSILGYWGMYLLGVHLGYRLFYAKHSNIRSTTSSIARVFLVSLLLWIVTILLDNYVERISRRTCNMPYVTWVLAQDLQALGIFMLSSYIPMNKLSSLEEAIDQNLLATFLLANLVTGIVNLTVDTIFASPFSSLLILTAYAFALSAIIGTIHISGFRLKFCYINFSPPPISYEQFLNDGVSSNPNLSPLVIAIFGIFATAFLLAAYYTLVSKYCANDATNEAASETGRSDIILDVNSPESGDQDDLFSHESSNAGLDDALIKKIGFFKLKKHQNGFKIKGTDCSICLGEFNEDESLRLLPKCNHTFHVVCIDRWLKSHSNCPLCRTKIIIPTTQQPDHHVVVMNLDRFTSNVGSAEGNVVVVDHREEVSVSISSHHPRRFSAADIVLGIRRGGEEEEENYDLENGNREKLVDLKRSFSSGELVLGTQGRTRRSLNLCP